MGGNVMKKILVWMLLLGAAAAVGGVTGEVRASELPDGLYYLEAEVVEQQADYAVFATVDGAEPTECTYARTGNYREDVPYLLTMDSMGTAAPEDDEILVVWQCVDEN